MSNPAKQESSLSAKPVVRSNTQQAVETLREMIVENRLASGSNHLESELASLLGMSRTPIREAALILQAQGLVEVKPRHGIRILSLAPEDMSEIYDILTELECHSAELAAGAELEAKEFQKAENAIEKMHAALLQQDLEAWAEADDEFHWELVRLGGNTRIADIVRTYNDQVRRARKITLNLRPVPTKSNDDHRTVLAAIKSGRGKEAREVHRRHRVQAKQMLVGILEKYGLHSV